MAVVYMGMIFATAHPTPSQILLGEIQNMPPWALEANPATLERNIQATASLPLIRIHHPFVVPVDEAGRPTGLPSWAGLLVPLRGHA
jgi:hypothetical protein